MSLRRMCRELVLEALVRRCLAVEGGELAGRIQLVVDELTLRALTSFLRMADLHSQGVTSVELLEREREPLPDIDALYILRPEEAKVARILDDFKTQANPQHCQVHLAFTDLLPQGQMERLAGGAYLAPRIRTLVEAPLTFMTIEDRGFHFDMPQALPRLFPKHEHEAELVRDIALRLADVCTCLQATAPKLRHAASPLCECVADQLQKELSAQRRPLAKSSKANDVPLTVLIVDRSVDMVAALVHEWTYEALAYDLLDGTMLDIDHHIVATQVPSKEKDGTPIGKTEGHGLLHKVKERMHGQEAQEPGNGRKQALLSEADQIWQKYRHEHIQTAKGEIKKEIDKLLEEAKDQKEMSSLSTQQTLQELRKLPEFKDSFDKLQLHADMLAEIFVMLETIIEKTGLAYVEQDCACGINQYGKDVKATNLQEDILKLFRRAEAEFSLPGELKLRLLMLYFTCVANVPEAVRRRLMDASRLEADDQKVLLAMMRTRLMEVPDSQRHKLGSDKQSQHRVTKSQAARFKKNALTNEIVLSRFEPRVKELLEQLAENRLSEEDFPSLGGRGSTGLRSAAGPAGGMAAPLAPAVDDWSFASAPDCSGAGTNPFDAAEDVSQRIVVFVIGGITYSELRAGAEVARSLPKGAEVFVGGTAVLTPKKLIQLLRPSSNPFDETGDGDADAAADDKV